MSGPMKLQFSHQDHQHQAVQAVVQVFDGQPMAKSEFSLVGTSASVHYAHDGSIGNALVLSDAQLLENVRAVQQAQGMAPSDALIASVSDAPAPPGAGPTVFCPLNFSIEMETGTGKTYAFIKTMYELNRVYGFKKFVVVVPSVAIREGTMKNLAITRSHFAADYAQVPCVHILYDSSKLTELRHFAQSDALSVLVINIDSFTKDSNKIKQKGERAFAPIEYIQSVRPIVIVDEPQNFETDVRRRALQDLNPLCTLRYSATHQAPYNLLYRLNPVQAYDLGLVKQIEVDGVLADDDQNQAYVKLEKITPGKTAAATRIVLQLMCATAKGMQKKSVTIKAGDTDLQAKTGNDRYAGLMVKDMGTDYDTGVRYVTLSDGRMLREGDSLGGLNDDVMRFQIERTVAAHFAKLRFLQPKGIKVLSLFFIDKVANYRGYDDEGNPSPGKLALWFEQAFNQHASLPSNQGLIPHPAQAVHNGYFSGDKKGKGANARTVWVDTSGSVAKDDSTYQLIMKDKERLLSLDEPLQFIFSHSALREGWDNPNVFQICTLNETRSTMKKRQEIGRGLRLCVNQQGVRVMDKQVNVLTVVANESYEAFAQGLQQEIQDDTGMNFEGRVKNARAKARIERKPLSAAHQAMFTAIWNQINYQTCYSVRLDTPALIEACRKALANTEHYPKVRPPKIRASKGQILLGPQGVTGIETGRADTVATGHSTQVPDVYAYIQNRVHLSRETLFAILDGSGRLDELLVNAQAFLDTAVRAISTCLQHLITQGIEYHTMADQRYEMSLFDEALETYLSSVYPPPDAGLSQPLDKTLLQAQPLDEQKAPMGQPFACVLSDSEVESRFSRDCALSTRVKFFFKLPSRFKIPTPLGTYNPDWAVVMEDAQRVFFVLETKSTTITEALRPTERLKIDCGKRHFALNPALVFRTVTGLADLD